MDKRLPLALILSVVVLLVWQLYFAPTPERQPARTPAEAPAGAPEAAGETPEKAAPVTPVVGESEERELELQVGTPGQRGSYYARFSNRGGSLIELRQGDSWDQPGLSAEARARLEHWTQLVTSVESPGGRTGSLAWRTRASSESLVSAPLETALWAMRELPAGEAWPGVEFELDQGRGVRFVKRVQFEPDSYHLRVQLELHNHGLEEPARQASFALTPAEVMPEESRDTFYQEPQAVAAGMRKPQTPRDAERQPELDSVLPEHRGKTREGTFSIPMEHLSFAGVHNKYFAMLLRAADARAQETLRGATWRRVRDPLWATEHPDKAEDAWRFLATDVLVDLQVPAQGANSRTDYILYAGPKAREVLTADYAPHETLVREDLGFFSGIANLLLWVMGFFERLTANWGVAIILLTFSVRLILFPVNRRSQTAMARYQKKMKRVQPQIEELKKRYEKDPQKMRQEQALLMQREGAFPPLGGCLPMFVQIPIFFGLFQALRTSFDLRHAPFALWIHDLSKPDAALTLDLHTGLPLIGTIQYLNVLPPLMVVLWVLQQLSMPKPADEQAARMQRMMLFMPVVMGFFLYNYAAGLSLYMITQSGLGILEQKVIKKYWPVDDTEVVKKKSGFMERLGRMQEEQMKRMQQQPTKGRKGGKGRR